MPQYEYEIPELGQRVTLIRAVEERDAPIQVVRRTVPDSITIAGSASNPFDFDQQYQQGLRRVEERGMLPRDFTKAELKQAATTKVD